MKILGKNFKVFGGGFKKVEYIRPFVEGRDVLDMGVVAHDTKTYEHDNWLHKHIVTASKECVGIDMLDDGIAFLREKGFQVQVGDAQGFNLNRQFDVIVAGDIIEHLHDFPGFFGSVRKHLKPNGRLIITTCNPWFFVRCLQALFKGKSYVNPEHTAWFCAETLSELVRRFGFHVEESCYGSTESFLYKFFFLPHVIRHTSIWLVCRPNSNASASLGGND